MNIFFALAGKMECCGDDVKFVILMQRGVIYLFLHWTFASFWMRLAFLTLHKLTLDGMGNWGYKREHFHTGHHKFKHMISVLINPS